MKRKGFTPTTLVLVAMLLGAVVWVGKIVNPPPPGPPAEAPPLKPATAVTPPTPAHPAPGAQMGLHTPKFDKMDDKEIEDALKKNEKASHAKAAKHAPPVKKFDPNTIVTDSTYFRENPDGQKGIEIMQKRVAEAKAEQEKERAEYQKTHPKGTPVTPSPIPPQAGR